MARITGILLEHLQEYRCFTSGDLFERFEIRDLRFPLVAIDAEAGGSGLVRVAAMPEYAVPRQDALNLIRWAQAIKIPIYEALLRVTELLDLSEPGRAQETRKIRTAKLQGTSKSISAGSSFDVVV